MNKKEAFFHSVLFQCFYMYKIYLKYFTLKLANGLLLKTMWSLCEWVHKHTSDAAFWPTASRLKCLWCNTLHQIKHVREEFPFLNIHPADSAQSGRYGLSLKLQWQLVYRYLPSHSLEPQKETSIQIQWETLLLVSKLSHYLVTLFFQFLNVSI